MTESNALIETSTRDSHPDTIESIEGLEAIYASARPESRSKQQTALTPAMTRWLAHSPFFVLASVNDGGIDCSPRGDATGTAFRLLDAHRIALPDRRGNNRIDTLRNLVRDPRVGLVFLVPGIEETLRVRGHAVISVAPELMESFRLDDVLPTSIIVVTIDAVWVQNFRAIRRADLWRAGARPEPGDLPDAQTLAAADTAHPDR